ncbi:MAG: flavodoxin family protein, partial [Planctomycetota bacterium]
MKLTSVIGSPKGMDGNTGTLLQAVQNGARHAGAEVTALSLDALDVRPCRGCETCHEEGDCCIVDDFPRVRDPVLDSDIVVLASPNYIWNVSAQMKALMDRCCGPLHLRALEGSYGGAVVTSGGGGEDEVADYLLQFLRAMGCWTVGGVGARAGELQGEDEREEALERGRQLGRRLVEAAAEGRRYPEQEEEHRQFAEQMKQLVLARRN